jgi:hypothetical protein
LRSKGFKKPSIKEGFSSIDENEKSKIPEIDIVEKVKIVNTTYLMKINMKVKDIYNRYKDRAVSYIVNVSFLIFGIFLIYSVIYVIFIILSLQKQLLDNNIHMNKIELLLNDIQNSISSQDNAKIHALLKKLSEN